MYLFVQFCVVDRYNILKYVYVYVSMYKTYSHAVPKLQYLNADGLTNGSILLEWRLEYDGGHPITNFEIHISMGTGRARRGATPPDIVYHTDVNNGLLVTRVVSQGQTYAVSATASNMLGASEPQIASGKK